MVRYIREEHSAQWKGWKGYDLDDVEGDITKAPFVPKKQTYQPFWALWGFKFKQRPWMRPKIYTRSQYLTILVSILPGLWMDEFITAVVDYGVAHVFQVLICVIFVAITLIYAECFVGDYTKRSGYYIWNLMPISFCFLIIQLALDIAESVQGCMRTVIFFTRIVSNIFRVDEWKTCPEKHIDEYVCFDAEVDTLSIRCISGDPWVECPDKTKYILPTHYYLREECNKALFSSPELIIYLLLHWLIVTCIASQGLISFVKSIKWIFIVVACIYVSILIYLVILCGGNALNGMKVMSGVEVSSLVDARAWFIAFVISVKMCSWGIMNNFTVSSGIIFRTVRWMDCLFLLILALVFIIFLTSIHFSILGCLAASLNTLTKSISHPKGVKYTDVFLTYYLSDKALGPLFISLHHFSGFALHIWTYAALLDAQVYGIADLVDMLEWQSTLLLICAVVQLALSFIFSNFIACALVQDTPTHTIFLSLLLIHMGAIAMAMFWLYGARTIEEDHFFMYGYKPLGFISWIWPWTPTIFIMVMIGDILLTIDSNDPDTAVSCAVTYLVCLLLVIVGIIIIILRQRKRKLPFRDLFRPLFTWGPPNGPLRRARKKFKPRTALSTQDMARYQRHSKRERSLLGREFFQERGLKSEATRWKRALSGVTGMSLRGDTSGELENEAARSMVYAEDVDFFELVNTDLEDIGGELPGTLPHPPTKIIVDTTSPVQGHKQQVEFMTVEPTVVKGMGESVAAEGVRDKEISVTEIEQERRKSLSDAEESRTVSELVEQTMTEPDFTERDQDAVTNRAVLQQEALRRGEQF